MEYKLTLITGDVDVCRSRSVSPNKHRGTSAIRSPLKSPTSTFPISTACGVLQLQASSNMSLRINIPPATRICLVSLLTLSLLYNIARWRQIDTTGGTPTTSPLVPYLTLVPSFFFYYPWTIVTATFVEQNIFTVLLNAATIFYGGKYLERAWGSREFSKFIAVVAVIPCIAIIPVYLIWGAVGGSSSRAYAPPKRAHRSPPYTKQTLTI